jgi:hypothetical protein
MELEVELVARRVVPFDRAGQHVGSLGGEVNDAGSKVSP